MDGVDLGLREFLFIAAIGGQPWWFQAWKSATDTRVRQMEQDMTSVGKTLVRLEGVLDELRETLRARATLPDRMGMAEAHIASNERRLGLVERTAALVQEWKESHALREERTAAQVAQLHQHFFGKSEARKKDA